MHYTGTCQVCGARLRIYGGKVAIHQNCYGSNKPPFEHENTRAKIALDKATRDPNAQQIAKTLSERLKNWQPKPLTPEA